MPAARASVSAAPIFVTIAPDAAAPSARQPTFSPTAVVNTCP